MRGKTYVYDEMTKQMVEGRSPPRVGYSNVYGDLPDFVSPVDGSIVHGRAGMRRHFKQHNVTHSSDFTDQWKKASEQRASFYNTDPKTRGAYKKEVVRDVVRAVNKLSKN